MLEGTLYKTHFVYILKSADGRHYTGISQNALNRFIQHYEGKSKSTRHMVGKRLVYVMQTASKYESARLEKRIKQIGANVYIHQRTRFCTVVNTQLVINNNLSLNLRYFFEYLHVKQQ